MKIEYTPPKAVADTKTVTMGDSAAPFRIVPTPPKAVA
jgi:hypothetical protein